MKKKTKIVNRILTACVGIICGNLCETFDIYCRMSKSPFGPGKMKRNERKLILLKQLNLLSKNKLISCFWFFHYIFTASFLIQFPNFLFGSGKSYVDIYGDA